MTTILTIMMKKLMLMLSLKENESVEGGYLFYSIHTCAPIKRSKKDKIQITKPQMDT
jgi:hypothetical protein